MTEAEKAYAAAEEKISEAIRKYDTSLLLIGEPFRTLETLPPEIEDVEALRVLDLDNTAITDAGAEAIARIEGLQTLFLSNTAITDAGAEAIARIEGLQNLFLRNTAITDAGAEAIARIEGLKNLSLDNTAITDTGAEAIARIKGLKNLSLNNTAITEKGIAAFVALSLLEDLSVDGTDVLDLRPLASLPKLAKRSVNRFNFKNTAATRADPRIAEIAEIEDTAERARTLFDYLKDWEPPRKTPRPDPDNAAPSVPAKRPAPLQTEYRDGQLIKSAEQLPLLSDDAADTRAETAWSALKEFRDDFVSGVHLDNYRPLAKAIASFDRALGESYAELNVISLGIHGDRIIALSQKTSFKAELPEGSDAELEALAAAIDTYRNRFPDWLDYLDDGEQPPSAEVIAEAASEFDDLAASLRTAEDVSTDVAEEFAAELDDAREDPSIPSLRKGLIASTKDILITLSEHALSVARAVGREPGKLWETAKGEARKYAVKGLAAVAFDIIVLKSTILVTLANQFPAQLGWIKTVLTFLGLI